MFSFFLLTVVNRQQLLAGDPSLKLFWALLGMTSICLSDVVLAFFFFLKVSLPLSLATFTHRCYTEITRKLGGCGVAARRWGDVLL